MIDLDQSGFAPGAEDRLTYPVIPGGEMDNAAKEGEEQQFPKLPPLSLTKLNDSTTHWSYYAAFKIVIKHWGSVGNIL